MIMQDYKGAATDPRAAKLAQAREKMGGQFPFERADWHYQPSAENDISLVINRAMMPEIGQSS